MKIAGEISVLSPIRRLAAAAAAAAPLDSEAFLAHIARRLRRGRSGTAQFSVLCLRIDQVDAVAEALGPLWCEALLGSAASRMAGCLGPHDRVATLGGGRFAVLLDEAAAPPAALAAASRIQRALGAPLLLGGHEVFATASVGVGVAGAGTVNAAELMRDAAAAMAESARRGPGQCSVFEPAMHLHAVERLRLEGALRRALERREFELHYQPIVSTRTGAVTAFEALMRWRHPERGLLPPSAFLAAAEASGVLVPAGRWVLAQACRQAREWGERHPGAAGIAVGVNLSARQLRHPGVVADVEDALAGAGLAANRLHLEITESAIMESGEAAVETLCRLKALGVMLCVDDFGVGYSSLSYLHRFPVDVLKIDRSFIAGLGKVGACGDIVRAVVGLAHGLGMHVVPEGVETSGHLAEVRAMECDFAQGYFFSRALPADEAGALLAAGTRW
ncbi:MAG TPA: bifunctional diguanylate cyclase/phosphodiesterase [Longimicrobium sp.]|nr:bifunctional diguanylate cyclase/phosphodiesterase [Longimicrobium sp.]